MKEYSTYLFDVDGTLLNTMELIFRTFQKTCRVYGNPDVTRERVCADIGIPLAVQMELYLGPLGEGKDEILNYHINYQKSIYPEYLEIYPGVREVLDALDRKGKRIGIVTSRSGPSLLRYLKHFEIDRYFSVIATPECTKEHKPSPEPVLWALKQLSSNAGETLFVGDAAVDMNSGAAAGVDTGFAEWGPNQAEDLPVRPTWILKSLRELLRE